jgi:hypothetical protein
LKRPCRRHTGLANIRILENSVRLCEQTQVEVVPRLPLIPGITDTPENLAAIEAFLAGRRCHRLEWLLPRGSRPPVRLSHRVGTRLLAPAGGVVWLRGCVAWLRR